jgi:hypothetical protein
MSDTGKLGVRQSHGSRFIRIAWARSQTSAPRLAFAQEILDEADANGNDLAELFDNPSLFSEAEMLELRAKVHAQGVAEGIEQERRRAVVVSTALKSAPTPPQRPSSGGARLTSKELLDALDLVVRQSTFLSSSSVDFIDTLRALADRGQQTVYLSEKRCVWLRDLLRKAGVSI